MSAVKDGKVEQINGSTGYKRELGECCGIFLRTFIYVFPLLLSLEERKLRNAASLEHLY